MDLTIFFYMWDSRWVWGLPYPERPSRIWLPSITLYILAAFQMMNSPDTESSPKSDLQHLQGETFQSWLMLLSGIFQLLVFIKQQALENEKMFEFEIDEHQLRINHYFKRK